MRQAKVAASGTCPGKEVLMGWQEHGSGLPDALVFLVGGQVEAEEQLI